MLIICPASLKLNWYRELSKWLTRKMSIGIAEGDCFPSSDIVIINPDILHKFEKKLSYYWDLIAVDEAHYFKNPKARRTQCVFGYRAKKGEEDKSKPGLNSRRKCLATGTPIPNKMVELWPLISWLDPARWNNFFNFAKRYCDAKKIPAGRKMVWDFSGSSNESELQEILRSTIMLRRLKMQVLKDLPPKMRQVIELPSEGCASVIRREQDAWKLQEDCLAEVEAEAELAKASDDPEKYKAAVGNLRAGIQAGFGAISLVRHETALAKIPLAIDHIKECLADGRKIIVFAWHHDVIDRLMAELRDFNPVKVTGSCGLPERQQAVDRFQKDDSCKVFIGNIKAAGVGLTLTASSHVIFVELDWTPGNVTQAEDRAHRIGQINSVLVQHLVLAGSLDANMAKKIVAKQDVIDRALDRIKAEIEASAPVRSGRRATESVTFEALEKQAEFMTAERAAAIHKGLKILAGVCNGARDFDGMGFSKVDVHIGHSLADSYRLTPKQAALGARLVNKYRGQLPEAITAAAKG